MRLAIGDERHFANELRGLFRSVSFRREGVGVPVDKAKRCGRTALGILPGDQYEHFLSSHS
jgi:hypothetical protein